MGDELREVRALGSDDGSLSVTWDRDREGLTLVWLERLAQAAEPRPGRGFGTMLVEMSLRQLDAAVDASTTPRASG